MNKGIRYKWNSFFGRIIFMVTLGIGLIAVIVSVVVLSMSQNAFRETYGKSQEHVFNQLEKELNDLHTDLQDIVNAIDSSWAFRLYLSDEGKLDNVQNFQNIYQMEKDLEQSKAAGMERLNILVLSMHGKHYLSRTETISMSDEEILASEAVKKALEEPEAMHYLYSEGAYTATTKNSKVMIVSKALYYRESMEPYAVVHFTLTMEDMKQYYDYFVNDNTSWVLVDETDTIVCSDKKGSVGQKIESDWFKQAKDSLQERFVTKKGSSDLTIVKKNLAYYNYSMYGVIDNNQALDELYIMPLLMVICIAVGLIILIVCLIFTGKTIAPLSELVEKMAKNRDGKFHQYMEVKGTLEVQELAVTYNYMLDDIQNYIAKLLETQKAQRAAEIKALQMQINPHYINNTLASIKWLVYQQDVEKTVNTIDAFIALLRNTISNTDEFITVSQEQVNLENYILINHTRYGDAVQVEFYVSHDCYDYLLPKLVVQPFIENAFFHAFPSGRRGTIQIFVKQREGVLEIQVIDDGVGMDADKAREAVTAKKEHFSGIGIQNVQDRLQLLYGEEYGIRIESREEKGTKVIIRFPAQKKEVAHEEK